MGSKGKYDIIGHIARFRYESFRSRYCSGDFDDLMQKRRNSVANAVDLRLFCIKPSTGDYVNTFHLKLFRYNERTQHNSLALVVNCGTTDLAWRLGKKNTLVKQ